MYDCWINGGGAVAGQDWDSGRMEWVEGTEQGTKGMEMLLRISYDYIVLFSFLSRCFQPRL
ncbi:hypothetical protein I7I50_08436 [Histoplasma capsulatum G186AR]|uniref:Uncharacterized protein n=1 Tax=Ajellomyces capsulatus TaxID=5037 RepID=A0A8H7YTW2_AJECA|nr:hypothetical protein I7I52_05951 [Histoplasma capsulatum]QSS73601.1 hypothetical protein I7I50_08436 [Histoplasma capsulatum G186AR]